MKVKASPIKTTNGTVFVLRTTENKVLHYAPNRWKTRRGAERWASDNGYNVQKAAKKAAAKAAKGAKTAPAKTLRPAAKKTAVRKTTKK